MIEAGSKAPEFTLKDSEGKEVSLSSFRGKKVILYFYPRDNTPGCTREAHAFSEANAEFSGLNAVVIGLSRDSESSHRKFAEKYNLPFILLSDPGHEVLEAYGAWQEKRNYGRISMGTVRSTVVIDEKGFIEKTYDKVKPDTHPGEVLSYLRNGGHPVVSGQQPSLDFEHEV